jgi:uncharacterized membrane protein YdjX (TVP38/TMEM64 family)
LRLLGINFSKVNEEDIKAWVESLGFWGPTIYIIVYIFRPLILLPAAIYSASAGVIWGLKGFVYVQIGANISAAVEFLIARYFAREAVEKFLKGKISNIDKRIEEHGFLTVLLVRLIPNLPWDVQNLSLGLTKVKFRHYFFATLIGIMPASFALVYGGKAIIKVLTDPKNLWMVVVAVVIFVGVFYLQKTLRKKHAS